MINHQQAGKRNSGKKDKKGKRPRKNSESITRKIKKNKIKQGLKKINERKRQKGDKKSSKEKKGPNSKTKRRRKQKILNRKNKKSKNTDIFSNSRQTCSREVTSECLEVSILTGQITLTYDIIKAAKEALVFENNQVNNFLKKFTRYKNHNKTTGNKLLKKGNFEAPRINMEKSLGK